MVKLLQDSRNKSICHIVRVQDKLVDCYSQVYTWDRIWFIVFSPHCLCLWFLTSNLIHWHSNRFFSSLCLWKSVFSTDFQIKKKKSKLDFRGSVYVCVGERERERGISFVYTIGFIVKKYLSETRLLCLYKETEGEGRI